jgi:signal transduction histidine kinase
MAERLTRELRAFHELARIVTSAPFATEELLERVCAEIRRDFALDAVTVVGEDGTGHAASVPLEADGRSFGYLVCDGRRLERQELELLRAVAAVVAAVAGKAGEYGALRRFTGAASHELRTPIAVVHGIAATLRFRGDTLQSAQLDELHSTLFEQTARLRDLADQLLDLSRLESGALALRPEPFRPRERIETLLPRLAPDRLDEIEVAIPPEVEVETDPHGFERVAANLITNALRYGEPPVFVRGRANDGETFKLVVEDRGGGVDPDFVPQLFDRFTRSAEAARVPGGTGLGLAIAQELASALGGELRYEPAEPKGAKFTLELPLASARR